MSEIKRIGSIGLIETPIGTCSFETMGFNRLAQNSTLPFYNKTRQTQPLRYGDFKIVPYGQENNYPDEIRQALDDNNLTSEILNKQTQLLWGQGPELYKVKFEDGKRIKEWVSDPEINAWLKSWDYNDYLLKAVAEYRTMNGHFTRYHLNKGARLGLSPKIASLAHVSSVKARLEWPDEKTEAIKGIICGNFDLRGQTTLTRFNIFDPYNPFAAPVTMRYSNLSSFALDNEYSRSSIHGSLSWIRLASSIAKLLFSFNSNSMSIKYHIESPAGYWDTKREQLERKCAIENIPYKEEMLTKLQDDALKAFSATLTGQDNVGKFVHTQTAYDSTTNKYEGWKIEPLDQKIKDFVDAQLEISKRAALETTSGLGLHPALSNISNDGNLPSGSEQLYAFKLYLMTGVEIPEMIVCKDINNAIAANFPNKDLKLGFYHDVVMTEEATTAKNRIKNN